VPESDHDKPLAKLRHDLRTPINHILGFSELLGEDLADRGVKDLDDLARVQTAARQLLELIDTRLSDENFSGFVFQEAVASSDYQKITTSLDSSVAEYTEHLSKLTGYILVVDDHPENREVLVKRLERQGHRTAQADNGRHALEMMAASSYDLVLLDVMMPEMYG